MKLVSYVDGGGPAVGFVLGGNVFKLQAVDAEIGGRYSSSVKSMESLVECGNAVFPYLKQCENWARSNVTQSNCRRLEDVELLAPLAKPVKLRCFSVYEGHMRRSLDALVKARLGTFGRLLNSVFPLIKVPKIFYKQPVYYKGNHTSMIGPGEPLRWPSFPEDKLDYEVEMALVIGRRGSDIPKDNALEYVFGYTIFNDFSARSMLIDEVTKGVSGPLKGKDFDTSNAFGPFIVTADEVEDPNNLSISVQVNGQLKGECNTNQMYWSVESCIAQASIGESLLPGEILATGAATYCTGIESWSFLDPGDTVTAEIHGLGALTNEVRK